MAREARDETRNKQLLVNRMVLDMLDADKKIVVLDCDGTILKGHTCHDAGLQGWFEEGSLSSFSGAIKDDVTQEQAREVFADFELFQMLLDKCKESGIEVAIASKQSYIALKGLMERAGISEDRFAAGIHGNPYPDGVNKVSGEEVLHPLDRKANGGNKEAFIDSFVQAGVCEYSQVLYCDDAELGKGDKRNSLESKGVTVFGGEGEIPPIEQKNYISGSRRLAADGETMESVPLMAMCADGIEREVSFVNGNMDESQNGLNFNNLSKLAEKIRAEVAEREAALPAITSEPVVENAPPPVNRATKLQSLASAPEIAREPLVERAAPSTPPEAEDPLPPIPEKSRPKSAPVAANPPPLPKPRPASAPVKPTVAFDAVTKLLHAEERAEAALRPKRGFFAAIGRIIQPNAQKIKAERIMKEAEVEFGEAVKTPMSLSQESLEAIDGYGGSDSPFSFRAFNVILRNPQVIIDGDLKVKNQPLGNFLAQSLQGVDPKGAKAALVAGCVTSLPQKLDGNGQENFLEALENVGSIGSPALEEVKGGVIKGLQASIESSSKKGSSAAATPPRYRKAVEMFGPFEDLTPEIRDDVEGESLSDLDFSEPSINESSAIIRPVMEPSSLSDKEVLEIMRGGEKIKLPSGPSMLQVQSQFAMEGGHETADDEVESRGFAEALSDQLIKGGKEGKSAKGSDSQFFQFLNDSELGNAVVKIKDGIVQVRMGSSEIAGPRKEYIDLNDSALSHIKPILEGWAKTNYKGASVEVSKSAPAVPSPSTAIRSHEPQSLATARGPRGLGE